MRNERAGPFLPHRTEAPMLIVECERLQQKKKRETDTKREGESKYQRRRKGEEVIEREQNNDSVAENQHY